MHSIINMLFTFSAWSMAEDEQHDPSQIKVLWSKLCGMSHALRNYSNFATTRQSILLALRAVNLMTARPALVEGVSETYNRRPGLQWCDQGQGYVE